ncbi:hypothetical protein [Terasakiella pusilla]|uniref:hypothetical protein n=1 Tax=Terasakiella pusilla TaxID=64973 RepID=UPI003AA8D44A
MATTGVQNFKLHKMDDKAAYAMLEEICDRLQIDSEKIQIFPVPGFAFTLAEYGEEKLTTDSYSVNEMLVNCNLSSQRVISVRFSRFNGQNGSNLSPLFDHVSVSFSNDRNLWKNHVAVIADVLKIVSSKDTPASHVDTGDGPSVLRELILSNNATHREIMASLSEAVEDMIAKRAVMEDEALAAEQARENAHTAALDALEAEREKLLLQSHMSERRNITTSIKDLMRSTSSKQENKRSSFFAVLVFGAYMCIGGFGVMSSAYSFSSLNDTGPSVEELALRNAIIERLSANTDQRTSGSEQSSEINSSKDQLAGASDPSLSNGSIVLEWFLIVKFVLSTIVALVGFSAAVAWMKRYYEEEMSMARERVAFAADIERASWVIEAIHEVKHEAKGELPPEWIEAVTRNLFSGGAKKEQEDDSTRALRALMGVAGAAKVGPNGLELDFGKKGTRSLADGG